MLQIASAGSGFFQRGLRKKACMRRNMHVVLVGGALLLTGACGKGKVCAGLGAAAYITPRDTTIAVGGSVAYQSVVREEYCAGETSPSPTTRTTRWHTTDVGLVALDSITGHATGLGVGDAVVRDDYNHVAVLRVR